MKISKKRLRKMLKAHDEVSHEMIKELKNENKGLHKAFKDLYKKEWNTWQQYKAQVKLSNSLRAELDSLYKENELLKGEWEKSE